MKKLFLFLFIVVAINSICGQDYSELVRIPLSNAEECRKAETLVMECSKLMLNSPCEENLATSYIYVFLIEWMGATSDYSFGFDDKLNKAIKSDYLFSRYLASMCVYALENKHKKADKKLQLESVNIFLEYCKNDKNRVDISRKLKKYIKAKNSGTLIDLIAG